MTAPATNPRAPRAPRTARAQRVVNTPFAYKIAIERYLFSLFSAESLHKIAEHLKHCQEGLDDESHHHFYRVLAVDGLFPHPDINADDLKVYDENIVRHTRTINEARARKGALPLRWKYFQYLALIFTEIYLHRFFTNPRGLIVGINQSIETINGQIGEHERIKPIEFTDSMTEADCRHLINKLAFWMATGSGKTLILHTQIHQFLHYLKKEGARLHMKINNVMLVTPNEGLTRQHLEEMEINGLSAEVFDKRHSQSNPSFKATVQIIEVTKLATVDGDKTVDYTYFTQENVVFVDEGHRGSGGNVWKKARDYLSEKGFCIEYSATFGQAIRNDSSLIDEYSKAIALNYSYGYFYRDGYGKDYHILNLDQASIDNHQTEYLVACMLTFYQQCLWWANHRDEAKRFNIEKPLWIFVGGSVTASLNKAEASDMVKILQMINGFVTNRQDHIKAIERVLNQGITNRNGNNIFNKRFDFLLAQNQSAEAIYTDLLKTIFNAPAGGALYLENIKSASGEIAIYVGMDNPPFGVINVGDDKGLIKKCVSSGLQVVDRQFAGSLFNVINADESPINLLLGAKKFTEGWSSWRVSTMGLLNVGKSEGAQIIQLFGRGVRLKGYGFGLKRTSAITAPWQQNPPAHIRYAETLGVFGIRADYMDQFHQFLEDEGQKKEDDLQTIIMPIVKNLGRVPLKTIRVKKTINGIDTEFGKAFRKLAAVPTLQKPFAEAARHYLYHNKVIVDWYPKIQTIAPRAAAGANNPPVVVLNKGTLKPHHLALLDWQALYFALEQYKAEKGWFNLNITPSNIRELLADENWYELFIESNKLVMSSYAQVAMWQDIALTLLRKYTQHYYNYCKKEWELPHLEVAFVTTEDDNFPHYSEDDIEKGYRVLVDKSDEALIAQLNQLKAEINAGNFRGCHFQNIYALGFERHLYQPLFHVESNIIEISPVPLNKGEFDFVNKLAIYCQNNPPALNGIELFLLRNLSKGRGVGFFEAGNFHPDFIMWLIVGEVQHVIFIDPKGLHHLSKNDPKLKFYQTIKEIETRIHQTDKNIKLYSFIISNTPAADLFEKWDTNEEKLNGKNIFFDQQDYCHMMIEEVLTGQEATGQAS